MRQRAPDIVSDFIERMLAADPNIDIRTADLVTYRLRQEFGGQRRYIAKYPPGDPRRRPWWKRARGLVD